MSRWTDGTRRRDDALLEAAALRFGTPFYLYDFDRLEARAMALRAALPARFELLYAVKANPSLAVVRLFAELGLGADVASRGEVLLARMAGVPGPRLLMTGPAKSDADLAAALAAGVGAINAEGTGELDRLEALAQRQGASVAVQLRVNPRWRSAEVVPILTGPGARKFGLAPRAAAALLGQQERWPHLHLGGIQVFNASNVLDARRYVAHLGRIVDLALRFHERGLPLSLLDFGGGLGVPYGPGEEALDLGLLARGLARLARRADRHPALRGTRLVIEPGRFLVAEAGVYVTRVVEVKSEGPGLLVLVDGGIHHLARPALVGVANPLRRVGPQPAARPRTALVAGPLCTSLDVLAEVRLPPPRPGDLLVFENAGAYGYTESMPLFLSHPWPAEIGRRGDRLVALRRAPTVEELLGSQRAPAALTTPGGKPG
jgi:diaminopimelate decarboxylase